MGGNRVEEDRKLVLEVLDGNIDSFNILVNKYEIIVLKFIYNIIKNKEAAEDISQEVFITVYNKLYTFKSEYKFSNWLFQIAKNKCIDYIRKYRRVYESNIEDAADITSLEISPEESMEYKETKSMVQSFLKTLEELDRLILTLRYTKEDFTFGDIAEVLNMNESAVKRRYYKIREKFKEYMACTEKRCRI
jgi:RNA polymerase sigma-70 factor, ECF subfamily